MSWYTTCVSAIVDLLRDYLGGRPDQLVAAYLFGSQARGTAGPHSDIDLGLLMRASPPRTLLGQPFALAEDLTALTNHPVEIVVLNDAPVDLVHRVLRDGVLVIDRDPSARIRFEVASRNAYFDLKPFLDRYRRTG
jgi:predicted nucleotidyltransferase